MVNKSSIYSVLIPFLGALKEKLHLARISRETGIPHPTARLWLAFLEEKGLLKNEKVGNMSFYALNMAHPTIIDYLVIAEKERLVLLSEKSSLISEMVKSIRDSMDEGGEALIFGSAALDPKKARDVDILIVGNYDSVSMKRAGTRLNKHLHIIQAASLGKVSEALKKEVQKKHLLIKGSESILSWFLWRQSDGAREGKGA